MDHLFLADLGLGDSAEPRELDNLSVHNNKYEKQLQP